MSKFELCPDYCLYDPDAEDKGGQQTCFACFHQNDVLCDPHWSTAFGKDVLVIGYNNQYVYIQTPMEDGSMSTSSVHKSQIG